MLQLKDIKETKSISAKVDYYVPVSIEIGEQNNFINEDPIYWRTGSIEKSLLEIGIGEKSGVLQNITLTTVENVSSKKIDLSKIPVKVGTPAFSLNSTPGKNIYDYIHQFSVYLSTSEISIVLGDIELCDVVINLDRVKLGINNNGELCIIQVTKLSDTEYKDLKDSLKI